MDSPSRKCIRLISANMPTLITPASPSSSIKQASVFAWVGFARSRSPQVGQFSVIVNRRGPALTQTAEGQDRRATIPA
jgi:hypothetical protein